MVFFIFSLFCQLLNTRVGIPTSESHTVVEFFIWISQPYDYKRYTIINIVVATANRFMIIFESPEDTLMIVIS